jgi:hypothetical protein
MYASASAAANANAERGSISAQTVMMDPSESDSCSKTNLVRFFLGSVDFFFVYTRVHTQLPTL